MKTYSLVTVIVSVVLALLVGYMVGSYRGAKTEAQQLFTRWKEEMRVRVSADPLFPPAPEKMSVLSGTVETLSSTLMTLRVGPISHNPFDTPAPEVRSVLINKDTKFFRLRYKTSEQITQERREADARAEQSLKLGVAPQVVDPTGVVQEPVKIQEITPGDTVTVAANGDIKYQEQFTATNVQVVKKK